MDGLVLMSLGFKEKKRSSKVPCYLAIRLAGTKFSEKEDLASLGLRLFWILIK